MYEALARELGLPADQKPMELLLLIELQQHRAPIKFTDPEAPVSAIKERANLMVYRYASQASGPSIGRAIHLFHRSAGLSAVLLHTLSHSAHMWTLDTQRKAGRPGLQRWLAQPARRCVSGSSIRMASQKPEFRWHPHCIHNAGGSLALCPTP